MKVNAPIPVTADRSKSRDWFDLYTLMRAHGYSAGKFESVFAASRVRQKMEIALGRLTGGRPHALDEGYESLAKAPALEEMSAFFREVASQAREVSAART